MMKSTFNVDLINKIAFQVYNTIMFELEQGLVF